MNREDIIRMAREACDKDKVDAWHNEFWTVTQEELERFAALVAVHTLANIDPSKFMSYREGFEVGVAAEREECAKVCDDKWIYTASPSEMAEYIRARSKE